MKRLARQAASWTRRYLRRRGYQLMGIAREHALDRNASSSDLPPDAQGILRVDNPRLVELHRRYGKLASPLAEHTKWVASYRSEDLDLARFRADNVYLWQLRTRSFPRPALRTAHAQAQLRYFLYGRYVRALDTQSLLDRLREDSLFGCLTYSYKTLPPLSRDLLDSINELYFLDRELGLFNRGMLRVLDIGAGYGRLAHRMHEALPQLTRYYCVDAVPESTFLCEFYTGFRGCRDKVTVVPLDEVHQSLPADEIDLAVNIHSFSETGIVAIAGWLDEVRRLRVPWLLIVPNDLDELLSWEVDGSRRDYAPLLNARGYRLRRNEPTIRDEDLRDLTHVSDHFLLFEYVG